VIRQFAAIAATTLLEGMQQPAALLLLLACVVLTGLTPVFQFQMLGEEGRLARDGGLAYMLAFGLALAATAAAGSLHAEIERGTAAAALSKPVPRPLFLAGKFAGVLALVGILWCAALLATLLAERASEHFVESGGEVGSQPDNRTAAGLLLAPALALAAAGLLNARRRVRFGVAAFAGVPLALAAVALAACWYDRFGRAAAFRPDLNPRVLPAAVLVLLCLAMFAALAAALATRLRGGPTLALCALALALGLTGDLWSAGGHALRSLPGGLLPNVQNFWMCDALADGGRVPWSYVGGAALYAAAWCGLALFLGARALRNRDLG
jgi:hypothetical protein